MTRNLWRRLERLEARRRVENRDEVSGGAPEGWLGARRRRRWRAPYAPGIEVRWLERLPRDYQGERHIRAVETPSGLEGPSWLHYEEVPGPGPEPPAKRGTGSIIWVSFVDPDPEPA